jgi:hypothetical protein
MKQAGLDQKLTEKGWQPTTDGLPSRHMISEPPAPSGMNEINKDTDAIKAAGTIVVELGTNDCCGTNDAFKGQMQQIYDKLKADNPSARFFWVNFYLGARQYGNNGAEKSQVLADFAKDKGITIIDWRSIAASNVGSDAMQVHPIGHYDAFVDLIVKSVGDPPKS